jgi:lipoprotein NlpD
MTLPDTLARSRSLARIALTCCTLAFALTACVTPKPHRAPVEERNAVPGSQTTTPGGTSAPAAADAKGIPAAEVNRAGFYTVRPGDTLIRIALDQGIGWRDLARWNGLDNPNLIEQGQVLRTTAPTAAEIAATTRPVAPVVKVEGKPLDPKAATTTPATAASAPVAAVPTATPPVVVPSATPTDVNWAWPAPGGVTTNFDDQRNNNGLSIGGKAGDPVYAAADGTVMYAGSGIRGYGNMIVIKHNDTYLSAYAHNQVLLVKEDQVVRRGQQIAQMGNSESDAVKLHFEIRRKGKPIDPSRLLPPR